MNKKIRTYLEDLIVEHGIMDIDDLCENEILKLIELYDFSELLINDDEYLDLVGNPDTYYNCDTSRISMIQDRIKSIICEALEEAFQELVINRRVETEYEQRQQR